MEYRVLGPLEALDASGRKLPLGGAMQQSVLASLLLSAGRTVALERLIDAVGRASGDGCSDDPGLRLSSPPRAAEGGN
jgi:hypothetical protein